MNIQGRIFWKPIVVIMAAAVVLVYFVWGRPKKADVMIQEIKPVIQTMNDIISTTGTILPKNRLEIKPPVSGRIESILVKEGQQVKAGDILAWMSSTERAALLDAARGQGKDALKYWQDVYKAIALISPIEAEVIVAKMQPGQTVTTSEAVVVLSDVLITRAQVDETDIGRVKTGQKGVISLDAYPEQKINAVVEHIYYESKTVNNVTTYEVDLVSGEDPGIFRSGMNATVDFMINTKENALTVPVEAVSRAGGETYVLVKEPGKPGPVKKTVAAGLEENNYVEIISGLDPDDTVMVKAQKYSLPKKDQGKNPFMPDRRKPDERPGKTR